MAPKINRQPPQSYISKALRHTLHPAGSTVLQGLLRRTPGSDAGARARALVLRILDGPCARLATGSARDVKANGSINQNLHGAWVFTYDQRMPNSRFDELTVICRGLLVVFPRSALLAEGFPEADLRPGTRLGHNENALLRSLCTSSANYDCRIFEPMPKFWEAGTGGGEISWPDVVQACGGEMPRLLRLEEKVDGNLGMLYPQLDDSLEPRFDVPPLLCTKGIAHSPDIERQMRLLSQRYDAVRLSPRVSHAILEVVDLEMKVVVPYGAEDTGARLIAAVAAEGCWLRQEAVDELAASWAMPRPVSRPLPPERSFEAVLRQASEYRPAPGELVDEGFVMHMACLPSVELVRLKVHTHFWDVVHGWWEDNEKSKERICVSSVLRVLQDGRFAGAVAAIEPCLVKLKGADRHPDYALVEKFRTALGLARCALDECLVAWAEALAATASISKAGGALKERLRDVLLTRPGLGGDQRDALFSCVMRMRGDPELGFEERMDLELAARFSTIARHVFGELGREPEVSPADEPLIQRLRHSSFRGMAQKLCEVWASVAQKRWEAERAGAQLDAPAAAAAEAAAPGDAVPSAVAASGGGQRAAEAGRDGLRRYLSDGPLARRVMEQIDTDGYAVLPGIFSPEEADEELARAWDFLETVSPGVDRNNQDTWWATRSGEPDPWPCAQRDMFQLHQAGWLFTTLRERFAERVFEPLYGTHALHASKDGFTFQRPTARQPLSRTPNDHFDQGTRWLGLHCIQGSVALTDQSPSDGCFQVWPGSHRLRERLLQHRPPAKGREDFLILTDKEWRLLQQSGIEPRRVPVKRGDVVLWRSDVAHCGAPPLGRVASYRLVVYVCCLPAALTPEAVYEQKRLAYEQLQTGCHYPNREEWFEARPKHRARCWQPYFLAPPPLTARQRQLYGLDRYEEAAATEAAEPCPVRDGPSPAPG